MKKLITVRSPLYLSFISIAIFQISFAEIENAQDKDTKTTFNLGAVVVNATKVDRELKDVAQAVSVRTDKDIQQIQAISIEEVLNRIPGVKFDDGFYSAPTIRGASRGQVIINVDGVNQTAASNKGMSINPLFIDPMLIQQVDILKGSSSALYGSGGIGGVISVRTKTVDELLNDENKNLGGFIRTRYHSYDKSYHTTVAAFGRSKERLFDYLVTADGYNSDIKNDRSSSHSKVRGYSGQFGLNFDPDHRLQLTIKQQENDYKNDVVLPDNQTNQTFQLKHELIKSDHLNLKTSISLNEIKRDAYMVFPDQQQDSKVKRFQFDTQNTHYLAFGDINHEITYGFNYLGTKQKGFVNGIRDNYANANGDQKEIGAFIQDVIDWNMISITPAIRYADYSMKGGDSKYDIDEKKILPSIGLVIRPTEWLSLYASYAKDFRAPSIDEMYTELHMPGMPIKVLPNPNLKPEHSTNYELGFGINRDSLFSADDSLSTRFTVFKQDVRDLIEIDPEPTIDPSGWMIYTTRNIANAKRSGVEMELNYTIDNLSLALAADYLKIKDVDNKSVSHYPKTLNTTVSYNIPKHGLNFAWMMDSASRSNRTGAGYAVHGLRVRFDNKNFELNAGVSNIFNRKYANEFGAKGRERTYTLGFAIKL